MGVGLNYIYVDQFSQKLSVAKHLLLLHNVSMYYLTIICPTGGELRQVEEVSSPVPGCKAGRVQLPRKYGAGKVA